MKIFNIIIVCFIIFIFFLLSHFERKMKFGQKKKILFFFTIVISFFSAFRVIGLDLEPYRTIFENTPITSLNLEFVKHMFSGRLEPFFVVVISILKNLGMGFKSFLFVSSFVPLLLIYSIITKHEKEIPLTTYFLFLSILLFQGPINLIRHFFAASIYLSALYSLSTNRNARYLLKSLFTVLIHYSNLSIVLIRPFLSIKWDRKKYIITMLLIVILTFMIKGIVVGILSNVNISINNYILWKFQYYMIYYNVEGYMYLNELHKILLFIMTNFLFVFNFFVTLYALKYKELIRMDRFYHLLLNSQIIGSFLMVFFAIFDASTLGQRLYFLFSIGSFLLVKEVIFKYSEGDRKGVFRLIFMLLCFYNFIIILYYAGIHDPNSQFYLL